MATFVELTSGTTLTVDEEIFDVIQELGGGGSRLVKLTSCDPADTSTEAQGRVVFVNPAEVTYITVV